MFAQHTVDSILALACIDKGVTEREKSALTAILSGDFATSAIVKYKDAARRLGLTVPTIKKLAIKGILMRVVNGGCRACGVTEDSLIAYASQKGK